MNFSRLQIAASLLMTFLFVVVTGGCTSPPPKKDVFIAYKFTGGDYSKLLEEAFGDDASYSGVNFFVLRNAWAWRVEPNGLLLSPGRARYVWVEDGKTTSVDMTPLSCPQLGPLLENFDAALQDTMQYAFETKPYQPTGGGDILDGPDYVIEVHGPRANIVIDPRGAFPSIDLALKITRAIRQCHYG